MAGVVTRAALLEASGAETLLFLEGPEYDVALVGTVTRYGFPEPVVCYDYDTVLAVLTGGGMTPEEAVEWFDFNIEGGWHGEGTPCFLHTQA